ncbi:MAG TPA: zinc ABC transporter substrate-binding protein [Actinomycetaceae bacterium]|nr:zinc ABC transporter substrate-binding protein [Actinomycetaceae bacterium]
MSSGIRNLLPLALGALLLAACAGASPPAPDGRLRVTVTTTHAAELVETVGGAHVEVAALMGPGVDPHLYRAGQGDVRLLMEADLVVHHGLFLEGRLSDVLQGGGLEHVLALTDDLPRDRLIEAAERGEQYDPHVWFDPELWVEVVDPVVAALSEHAPQHAQDFAAGGQEYVAAAEAAHHQAHELLSAVPPERRVLVTSHDAFGYFGRTYDLEVHAVQGLSTEDEAGIGDLRELVDLLVDRSVPALFAEASIAPAGVEAVREGAAARGWHVRLPERALYSDTLGEPGTPEGTYAGMLLANARLIAEELGA